MSVFHLHRRGSYAVAACCTATALALSACGNNSTALTSRQREVQSVESNVRLVDCDTQCNGELDGAKYSIKLPRHWNGTLLLYSHGYRFAEPTPPDFEAVTTNAQVSSTDADGKGSDALTNKLLDAGYALAGSSYRSNGWAVADGVKAGQELHDQFVMQIGAPKRTYVWGDSLGGLITQILAERNPSWVDGVAPMCGAVAGPNYNYDAALDIAFAVKALIDPQLKITGYSSAGEAAKNWVHAAAAVTTAAADIAKGGTAKVLFIAALVDAASRTKTYDGHDLVSLVKADVEAVLTALAFGTSGRYELEKRIGGNPSDNTKADYVKRISTEEAAKIKAVGGSVRSLQKQLGTLARVAADATVRDGVEKLGDTTGKLVAPTVTMHTEADPLVLVQNETVLAARVRAAGRSGSLVQLYITAPPIFSEKTKAPYGAGHCNFSDEQRIGLITVLDKWVRQSAYPVQAGIAPDLGAGYDPLYVPGPWPGDEPS